MRSLLSPEWLRLAKQLGAKRTEVIATSAVRRASNGQRFLDLVRDETGLRVRIVDGVGEAALSFRSALAHFDLGVGRAAILDIGGGSLELALSADGLVERLVSLPLGAIRMTEEFLPRGGEKGLNRLRKHVRRKLEKNLPMRDWQTARVICSGGTATNLAGIFLARRGMESARTVHGTVVPRVELEHIIDLLSNMSLSERQGVAGLNPVRADIIVAGLAVIAEVVARLEAREVVVSAYGIREGVLLEAARVSPVVADPAKHAHALCASSQSEQSTRSLTRTRAEARAGNLRCDREASRMRADQTGNCFLTPHCFTTSATTSTTTSTTSTHTISFNTLSSLD
jgi:exopolyphosphatase/guanosine-5'-triphosphate,3'-diphosphate pyrophosphatase